jgi:hypothetical protein
MLVNSDVCFLKCISFFLFFVILLWLVINNNVRGSREKLFFLPSLQMLSDMEAERLAVRKKMEIWGQGVGGYMIWYGNGYGL